MSLRCLLLAMVCAVVGCVSGHAGTRSADGGEVRFDGGVRPDSGGRDGGGQGDAGFRPDASLLEIVCDDGLDQDADGDIDCEDSECANRPCDAMGNFCIDATCGGCRGATTETMCGDGADEDCDNVTDCADPDCDGVVCGMNSTGPVMCMTGACPCPSGFRERFCGDASDDDCDGMIDCADTDCRGLVCGMELQLCQADGTCACGGGIEFCNGQDEDCNGTVDNGCPRSLSTCCGVTGGTFGDPLGGTQYSNPCPEGTMLIGIAGRASTRLDQIQRICAVLTIETDTDARPEYAYSVRRGARMDGAPQGGSGGTAFEDLCANDDIVIAVRVAEDDTGVTGIQLQCGAVSLSRGPSGWALSLRSTTTTMLRGSGTPTGSCAAGHVVTDLSGRASTNVNQLVVTCEQLNLVRL